MPGRLLEVRHTAPNLEGVAMQTTTRLDSELDGRTSSRHGSIHRHRLPLCETTSLDRFRDRHQARQGAQALGAGSTEFKVHTFACPDCRGYHLEKTYTPEPPTIGGASEPTEAFTHSLTRRKRRYILVDIENPTRGAKVTSADVAEFWNILKRQAPGIAPRDHVVVGASRMVVRKYRAAIQGANVKWVVGADAPDGADRALLAAVDLRSVARGYDELVIISGDHAFSDLARRAKKFGLTVHVVTAQHPEHHSMMSRELSAAADLHTLIRLQPRAPRPLKVRPATIAARQAMRQIHAASTAA